MAQAETAEATSERTFVCVWPGTPGECQNCGGSTRSIGEDGRRGPFEPDPRFCSQDCFEDAQEFAERARAEAASDWCPTCGYDRHEHADDCAAMAGAAMSTDGEGRL